MHARSLVRISLLVVAVAATALSCALDYTLDFEIDDILVGSDYVEVEYTLTNAGFRSLNSATINIRVTAQLVTGGWLPPMEAWTPGVDLSVAESVTDTLLFSFSGSTLVDATAVVVGAGWDEDTSTN